MPNPVLVQNTSEVLTTSLSVTTTLPGVPVKGNYLFLSALTVTTSASVISVSDNKGSSYTLAVRSTPVGAGNDFKSEIWYAKVVSTSTSAWQITVSATGTSSRYSLQVEEYSNLSASTASVLSTTAKGTVANTTALTLSITVVPSTAGLILAGLATNNVSTAGAGIVAPGGIWTNLWTESVGSTYIAGSFEYTIPVSSGVYTATWGQGSTASMTACMAFFQGATAAGGAVRPPPRFALLGVV